MPSTFFRAGLIASPLGLLLGACMLPLPVTIASTAIDVVLTVTTGKSKSDYLLSLVLQQDCVLFRIIEGEEICISEPQEIPNAIPKGLYARVTDPQSGEMTTGQVTRAQPVYSYADMPRGGAGGAPMQVIEQSLPPGATPGAASLIDASRAGSEIPMNLPR